MTNLIQRYLPLKWRKYVATKILGIDNKVTEHKVVQYAGKFYEFTSEHKIDKRAYEMYPDSLRKDIISNMANEIFAQAHEKNLIEIIEVETFEEMGPQIKFKSSVRVLEKEIK